MVADGQLLGGSLHLCLELLAGAHSHLLLHILSLGNELLQRDSRGGWGLPGGVQGLLQLQGGCDDSSRLGPGRLHRAAVCACRALLNCLGLQARLFVASIWLVLTFQRRRAAVA